MYYKLKDRIALRKWRYVDRALYVRGMEDAIGVREEEFELLEPNGRFKELIERQKIEQ